MKPFQQLQGIAAALPLANVDTDQILPARFLKTVTRQGLKAGLFADLRRKPGFVLNAEPWTQSQILITGRNFGCGSSREHAPWALLDFGIRCLIASGFADIFKSNCYKNGILPVVLPADIVEILQHLAGDPATAAFRIDLAGQTVTAAAGCWHFDIDPARKFALINGVDEVASTLKMVDDISRYEREASVSAPWNRAIDLDVYRTSQRFSAAGL